MSAERQRRLVASDILLFEPRGAHFLFQYHMRRKVSAVLVTDFLTLRFTLGADRKYKPPIRS